MPNHFEAVGFAVRDDAQLADVAVRAAEEGASVLTRAGEYRRWAPGGGAELWVQLDGNHIVGLTPHFAGDTSLRAGIVGRVAHPEDTALEGALHAWANPPQVGPADTGDYPFIVAVPDFRALDRLRFPSVARVQVAAFAHELRVYPSGEAYLDAQPSGIRFAEESFIPLGMFTDDENAVPEPVAVLSGRVLAAGRRTNPAGGDFWWMHVRTLGGEMDVVAEPALVDAEPVAGGVVSGTFYLSGRVSVDVPARGRTWPGRIPERHPRPVR
ncbi:hypothetical protein [Longimicrobium sp.]|uniref:hypothetical protein n=1 Tax=Longimicrobium sp. TaxID=2029185 RepID=UPI002E30B8AA|nr:hypothetical protein [Longimicrobium sp.]HEX6036522.1 hypothetical protein [Longimicrobium sp.]